MDIVEFLGGLFALLAIGMVATFVISFLSGFFKAYKELKHQETTKNNVVLHIDLIKDNGKDLYLLYEGSSHKFALQAATPDEVAKKVNVQYNGKDVILNGDSKLLHLVLPAFNKGEV